MGCSYGEIKVNIYNAVNQISTADATIFISITPVHNSLAIVGFLICLIATVSRRICTTSYAIAASVHILLVCWMIALWIDHVMATPPLLLAVVFRILLLAVSIILVFSSRLGLSRNVLFRKARRNYEKRKN